MTIASPYHTYLYSSVPAKVNHIDQGIANALTATNAKAHIYQIYDFFNDLTLSKNSL